MANNVKVDIVLHNISLALFKDQFDTSKDCVNITVDSIAVGQSIRHLESLNIWRDLKLQLKGKSLVSKCLKQDVGKAATTGWNIQ